METFTLWKEIHLQLESPDFTRQPFTMETFTLWSQFTLCPHTMEFSDFIPTQVGLMTPYKQCVQTAHRRSSTATVSPEFSVDSRIIANPPNRFFVSSQLCDFQPHSSPTPKPRQRMILQGFSSESLNKLAHASWKSCTLANTSTSL